MTGEICIRIDEAGGGKPFGLSNCYFRDEEMSARTWRDGLFHTGDTAYRDEEGFMWYVGRTDDIIKSSGYRIGPFEVESVLMEHPSVMEAAVTGVPDPDRGAVVKASIILAPGYQPSEELKKELQDYVKHTTAPYKYPRIVEFVDALPKTISGKIRRVEIREKDTKAN
jgi:acetyl-CoA synthetase